MSFNPSPSISVRRRPLIHDDVLAKSDLPVFFYLLEPHQSVAVGIQARNYVVKTVSIHVIGKHLRSAIGEWKNVPGPDWIIRQGSRLLPPAILLDDIHPPIPINIATTQSMREPLPIRLGLPNIAA